MARKSKRKRRRDSLRRDRHEREQKRCPVHGVPLQPRRLTNSTLWECPVRTCNVRCGSGTTSTPCDAATFKMRARAHDVFDPLWKEGRVFASRADAYAWLAGVLRLRPLDCHVGFFDIDRCRAVIKAVNQLTQTMTK